MEGYRFLQLQENAYKFSYAKANYVLEVVANAADDRKASVYKNLHENYTITEANHFTASARMAKKWIQIQNTQDEFPYLQYVTAHDDHVRPAHKALDGIIKPVNDPFWHTHYPPNGYNCRCTVKKLAELPENYTDKPLEPQSESTVFENNPGLTGTAFNENHRYFQNIDLNHDANKAYIRKQTRNDVKKTAFEKFIQKTKKKPTLATYDIHFEKLPYKLSGYGSDIKTFLDKIDTHPIYMVKNLLLPHIVEVLQGENITEVWESEPDQDEKDNIEKVYYVKTSMLKEWYFVLKLRKIEKLLTFYTITSFESMTKTRTHKQIYQKNK